MNEHILCSGNLQHPGPSDYFACLNARIPLSFLRNTAFSSSLRTMSKPPEDDQFWFILKEDLKQQDFVQKDILFSKIKANGLTLSGFLRILNLKGRPEEFSFHIHSASKC
jgi:hypothetical protein